MPLASRKQLEEQVGALEEQWVAYQRRMLHVTVSGPGRGSGPAKTAVQARAATISVPMWPDLGASRTSASAVAKPARIKNCSHTSGR